MYTNLEFWNRRVRLLFLVLIGFMLIFSAFLSENAAASQSMISSGKVQTEKKFLNIVVLGDSIAVGYELGFTEQSKPYGFGEQIYEQALFQGHRATYVNYGVLGLRSEGLLQWLEAAKQQRAIQPANVQIGLKDPRVDTLIGDTNKLYEDIKNADLILLSIGGNDFLQILTKLDLTKSWSDWSEAEREQLKSQLAATTSTYEQQLTSIISILTELNADMKIATQNQYLPLPKLSINGTESYIGVDSQLAKLLVEARTALNSSFTNVLDGFKEQGVTINYIDASSSIEANSLGLTSISSMDVHPNAAGYKKLSEQYSQLLWNDYRSIPVRKQGVPLSVVVSGKEVVSPYPTKLIKGRTYLVLRDITDAMGAKLSWSNKTQTATITIGDRVVELTIGAKTYKVNGKSYTLNAEPAFLDTIGNESKTYVPIAALSEGLDFFVTYVKAQNDKNADMVYVNR